MIVRSIFILLMLAILAPPNSLAELQKIQVASTAELQDALAGQVDSLEIFLQSGEYHLSHIVILDSTCGNCQDPRQAVPATAGLQISGQHVRLCGPEDRSAVIHTHAGYGIFFDHCGHGVVENLSITGGQRDPDPNATNAAIVVKNSTVLIRYNSIRDNIGDSSIVAENVVGIMGICGRENSIMAIEDNAILRNSWDGIALYRGAEAIITGNLIDGVDKAGAKTAGGGRGVAIGITWDARATIEKNLIRRYWKGLGIFVDAYVTARNNVVEDILTWGIALWDADAGAPVGFIEDNIIYTTGACGVTITRSQPGQNPGHLVGNVIIRTGQNPRYDDPEYYCPQCAVSIFSRPDNFLIADNIFFDNRRASEDLPDFDLDEAEFKDIVEAIRKKLLTTQLLIRSEAATFLADF